MPQNRKAATLSHEHDTWNDNDESNTKLPWPDEIMKNDPTSSATLCARTSCWIHAIYNRWTYSYMNRIFKKGALQKNNKSAETQLTQNDLYSIPTTMKASVLGSKFWKKYNEQQQLQQKDNKNAFFQNIMVPCCTYIRACRNVSDCGINLTNISTGMCYAALECFGRSRCFFFEWRPKLQQSVS
mmetsp:Transcript_21961/g.32630  ORF Transcript_21961/g.32630 Transcript_21961/m.32630 type:complete len:184 (+) Transcript_21961:97-648(+)